MPHSKNVEPGKDIPWFTPDLDQHKNILWPTALASNSPRNMHLFREVRKQYSQAGRKAKANFFKQICIL
jgi:hypothetical protein